jgi:hypothetical protein
MCDVLLPPGVNRMCDVLLPPGVNPTAVKHIYIYMYIKKYTDVYFIWQFPTKISARISSFCCTATLINNPTILDEEQAYETCKHNLLV